MLKSLCRLAACVVVLVSQASALTISLDFSLDANNFFGNATAKAAVEQAAADIGAAITTSLTAVTQKSFTSGSNPDVATLSTTNPFTHPATGIASTHDVTTKNVAADTVIIYVGSQKLTGNTLGQGGPGSADLSSAGTAGTTAGTVTAAAGLFTTHQGRGGGPIISSIGSTLNGHSFTVDYGSVVGNLWFDHDTDNNTTFDTDGWHFDHTAPVQAGKSDLYSVALHEILHAVGFGTAKSWDDLVAGTTTWNGPAAIALNGGSGLNLVDSGGGHIDQNVTSKRLSDGVDQEPVMTPSITLGTRKTLTQMDMAFLQDFGWDVASIPEPGSAALVLLALSAAGLVRRR